VLARYAAGAELTVFVTGSMADRSSALLTTSLWRRATRAFRARDDGRAAYKIRAGERGDVIVIAAEAAATLEQDGTLAPARACRSRARCSASSCERRSDARRCDARSVSKTP
jgi:hypothetical protein